ncbi:type VII secretion target [Streptomyces sp. cg35]|uniref:type VII secretion target n=1 Tax=Streptomyces sp. cg35 TaxID=3421650 RepID=UPI003D172CD9
MTSAEGYQVQHGAMAGQAKELDGAGDDVGAIGRAVESTMCYPQDTLGGADSGPAFNAFAAAWQAETEVLEAALHELADKVRLSSRAYRGSDIDVRDKARAVPAGDSRLSTQPAHAARPSALSDY